MDFLKSSEYQQELLILHNSYLKVNFSYQQIKFKYNTKLIMDRSAPSQQTAACEGIQLIILSLINTSITDYQEIIPGLDVKHK